MTVVDHARVYVADRIERVAEPAGGLADLVATKYPKIRLSSVTLAPATKARLERVLQEQRQRDLLASHGFTPLHRLLLTGPAGTGKSLAASALAAELSLPLVTIRIDALISKYTGETTTKIRVIFDAMAHPRAVYLFDDFFDEFGAIGAWQMASSDIADARRVLTMFLSFLDETQPESLVVAVTDHGSLLDDALIRRFDIAIPFALPDSTQALDLLRDRLDAINTRTIAWHEIAGHVKGLSHARLVRAAESAAKQAILSGSDSLSTAALITALGEHRRIRPMTGFSIGA
jgi:SpoVK/Ycf46/Vps4 family AAA+-type ATPase